MNDMNIYQPQSGDIYEPVDRAQKFREQQNALARQQAVRNALAQSIDPRTGRTNWQQAYAMGGADVAPDIQGLQQADMLSEAKLLHERGLGQKAGIDAETAYWTQQRDVASRIGDQASWSSWRSTLPAEFQQYVPEEFTPDNKRRTLATADKALELHFAQIDTGGGGYTLQMPATGGPAIKVPGSEFTKPPSASEAETRRHNLAMEGIARQRVSRTPTVGQTEKAKIDAKFAAAAPQAIQDAENAIKLIDQMVGTGKKGSKPHPGFSGAVGAGIGTRFIPGTDAASFEAMHNQLMGGAFLQAYETLRGGGQITEIEGQKATAARNRMNLSQSETEYIKAAREYQDVLRSVIARAKQRMGSATDVTDVGSDSDWTDL